MNLEIFPIPSPHPFTRMKLLVIYCTHMITNELKYFIDNGYYNSDDVDFYFCFNNLDIDVEKYQKNARDNGLNNIYFVKRENYGLDFAGWGTVLHSDINGRKLYENYDYFILLNSTCMGPYLPIYEKRNWTDLFISLLNDDIKLVGPTINFFYGKVHVQSYFMCTDKIGIKIGLDKGIFTPNNHMSKDQIVKYCEIRYSEEIIKAGYNVKCLLKGYEGINFKKGYGANDVLLPFGTMHNKHHCDPCNNDAYFGITFHPYEVIFFKSNRGISSNILSKYTQFHTAGNIKISQAILN